MNFSNEIIINKTFTHHDKNIQILSICNHSLWYAYRVDKETHDKHLQISSQRSILMGEILFRSNVDVIGLSIRKQIYCNGKTSNFYPSSEHYLEVYNHFKNRFNENYSRENTIIRQLKFKEEINCDEYYQYGLEDFLYGIELLIDSRKIYHLIEKEILMDFQNEVKLKLMHPIDNREFTCYLKALEKYNFKNPNQIDLNDHQAHKMTSDQEKIMVLLPFETDESIHLEVCPMDPSYTYPKTMLFFGIHFEGDHLSTHGMKVSTSFVAEIDEKYIDHYLIELLAVSSYSDKKFYKLEDY